MKEMKTWIAKRWDRFMEEGFGPKWDVFAIKGIFEGDRDVATSVDHAAKLLQKGKLGPVKFSPEFYCVVANIKRRADLIASGNYNKGDPNDVLAIQAALEASKRWAPNRDDLRRARELSVAIVPLLDHLESRRLESESATN